MNWEDFVGIPFKDRGRDFDGCDCWGLYRLVFLHEHKINLPLYTKGYNGRADRKGIKDLIDQGKRAWVEIAPGDEQVYDAVLMNIQGYQHLGMVVEQGVMLHMPRDSFSCIERYDNARYQNVVEGFYRYHVTDYDDEEE